MKISLNLRPRFAIGASVVILSFVAVALLTLRSPAPTTLSIGDKKGEQYLGATATSAPAARPSDAAKSPAAAQQKVDRAEDLLTHYNSDGNVRPLVAYALQHKKEGGAYYASRMLDECGGLGHATEILENAQLPYAADQPDYAKRIEAANRLSRRCSGLLPDEISNDRRHEIMADGVTHQDRLILASTAYATAKLTDSPEVLAARRAAMAQVLATQDPLLIDDLAMRLSLHTDSKTSKSYFWFGGHAYPLDSDEEVGGALYLLPCGMGMVCDATEFKTALRCAAAAECDASRFDHLKRIYQSRPGVYDKVMGLYEKMVAAAKAQDVGSFVK